MNMSPNLTTFFVGNFDLICEIIFKELEHISEMSFQLMLVCFALLNNLQTGAGVSFTVFCQQKGAILFYKTERC